MLTRCAVACSAQKEPFSAADGRQQPPGRERTGSSAATERGNTQSRVLPGARAREHEQDEHFISRLGVKEVIGTE